MKNDLRIVFMGTPDFAVATLKAIIAHEYKVVGVVTSPDKPAGRGRKIRESAVKLYAKSKGITILQPTHLRNEKFLEALTALAPNVQVVVAFRMLPKVVWNFPEYGTFNLHASLLPNYRGAAPINWAIINGETKTGVTTFFIDEKIDTGAIIIQKEVDIEDHETAGSLHDKLMEMGSLLVIETLKLIESKQVKTSIQTDNKELKSAPKLNTNNCRIDWSDTIWNINNKIRGLTPFPTAWSILQNGDESFNLKIFKAEMKLEDHDHEAGHLIVTKNQVHVAVHSGFICLLEIQMPGKRRMDIKSLLNGFNFHENAKML